MTDTVKHMWDEVEKARADGTFSSEHAAVPAQDAVACTCSQAGFPSSCYNCDAEASDIVNALRKLYSTHPICAQAANYIERKLRDMATPSEPLQCLRCGTVDAFGPAARSPAACSGATDLTALELLASNEWCADLATVSGVAREALAEIKILRAQVERWKALADDVPALVPDGSPIHPDPVLRDYFAALKTWIEQRDALKHTSTMREGNNG